MRRMFLAITSPFLIIIKEADRKMALSNGAPAAKRARPSIVQGKGQSSKNVMTRRPRLFQPFRALGLVTDDVPFVLLVRHGGRDAVKPDIHIFTCIGNSWMMWNADRMTLLFVGEPVEDDIRSLLIMSGSSGKDTVLAATGSKIHCFIRGKLVNTMNTEEEQETINTNHSSCQLSHLLSVGDNVMALSKQEDRLYVWSFAQKSLLRKIDLGRPIVGTNDTFHASAILHPSTYIDKVLLGSDNGHLQLYNFRTSTLLHTFTRSSLLEYMDIEEALIDPEESFAIVDLVQTPAIDIVAIVFEAGYILLLDIRYDEPILYARAARGNVSQGKILGKSSVSFRTDGMAYTMAVGTRLGDIILFDLENSLAPAPGAKKARPAQLAHTIRTAHTGSVSSVQFLQGQPLLISNGSDNAIRQWFFEVNTVNGAGDLGGDQSIPSTTAPPRLLKTREGHSAPPRVIRYIGEGGGTIISTGGDDRSVRSVSVIRDSRSAELSQGSLQKKANQIARPVISLKLSPAFSIAHSSTRTRDWDDLVTVHAGLPFAQSWSTRNSKMGEHKMRSTKLDKRAEEIEATAVDVSVCGNFSMVGNEDGYVEMYNIQSGRYRRRYDTRTTKKQRVAKKLKGGVVQWKEEVVPIKGAKVTGIASDAINKSLAASTADGQLHFFDFHDGHLIDSIQTRSSILSISLHRPSNLLACTHKDQSITLYDMETRKQVRLFQGFAGEILDIAFSPDGRWLVASCKDGFVRTFDIPTSRLVDYFYTKEIAISITFSPLGDFLATVHENSRGIFLWANRNQYLNLPLSGIDEQEVLNLAAKNTAQEALPSLRGVDLDELAEEDAKLKELDAGEAEYQRTFTSQPQLFVSDDVTSEEGGLLTLSTMPRSRWMTLLNLDIIKARNKPKEAPKKPEKAPFFLPVGAGNRPDSAIDRKTGFSLGEEILADEEANAGTQSKRLQVLASNGLDFQSEFSQRLAGALQDDQMDALFVYLNALSPPALDSEIRSLARLEDLTCFLNCMTRRLQQHLDYDAVQAMVSVALKIHGDMIAMNGTKPDATITDNKDADESDQLGGAMRALMAEQYREGNRLLDLVQYCMGSLAFVRDMPLV
jgi:U3 small nucleolar RNA-associated protein 21